MKISHAKQYPLVLEEGEVFYAKRSYEPSGHPPGWSLPSWNKSAIQRIFQGAWTMNEYDRPLNGCAIDFRSHEGHSFVEWWLDDGEAIVIDYRRLVGFSNTIQLHTEFSLNLATVSVDRLFFNLATGPGKVVFEVSGSPEIHMDVSTTKSFAGSRLVAWSADSQFGLTVKTGPLDYYLSSTYLVPRQTKGLLIDADEPGRKSGGFISSILRKVYSPF